MVVLRGSSWRRAPGIVDTGYGSGLGVAAPAGWGVLCV